METAYEAVAARYQFDIPDEYRRMESRGWFNLAESKAHYLWLHEAEWLRLNEIADYQFADYHKPGFVPFAFNGAGDLWCWWPEATQNSITPVVLCPHDCREGQFYAPNFLGFLYRQILDYATVGWIDADEEEAAREWLRRWHDRFLEFFPRAWSETVMTIANKPLIINGHGAGFIIEGENSDIIERDCAFPKLNQRFEWMT